MKLFLKAILVTLKENNLLLWGQFFFLNTTGLLLGRESKMIENDRVAYTGCVLICI